MSADRPPSRPFVVAVAVALVVATAAGVAVAVEEPRDEPADTTPPVRVYVSETLDISNVELTGGGTVGTDTTTFVSVAGDEVFSVAPESADFDGVAPGSYDAESDDDDEAELTVVTPRITEFEVRNERGIDIEGDTVEASDFEEVTITAAYNFAEADRLDVTLESPDGTDLAGDRRITESGGSLTVDTSGADPGTYRIEVEGSNIEDGSRTATVTVAGGATATPTATPTPTPTPPTTATPTPTPTPPTTATPTPAVTTTATATPTPAGTTTEAPGTGFGVVVGLAALTALTVAGAVRTRTD
jgi:hypothetical protein